MAPVPAAILRALSLPPDLNPSKANLSTSSLGSGFSSTGRLTVSIPINDASRETEHEEERRYFVKTSPDGKEMFQGEFASLNAIADVVPGFCPRALGWGSLNEQGKGYFLVTEFLDLTGRWRSSTVMNSPTSLAQRLAKLHSTHAPSSSSSSSGKKYGFPVPTYCGNTRQPNNLHTSWADFYANERLLMILEESERQNGPDAELRDLVSRTAAVIVPRLLGDDHLGFDRNGRGNGIYPVVVHGDLWSGNASQGRIVKSSSPSSRLSSGEEEEEGVGGVVYDPSACYAHSEYELGIMHMFGGFGKAFFEEYHSIVPKMEPVEEYDDRVRLYELYHHLNHHAIFGGGYRSGAVTIMNGLMGKYGFG